MEIIYFSFFLSRDFHLTASVETNAVDDEEEERERKAEQFRLEREANLARARQEKAEIEAAERQRRYADCRIVLSLSFLLLLFSSFLFYVIRVLEFCILLFISD
jgi:hypothetical protein